MNDNHKTKDGTRCRLTRMCFIKKDMSPENGRPIGTLAAWLEDCFVKDEREEHRDPFYIFSLEEKKRQDARQSVMCMPCGPKLADGGTAPKKGEPEEPKVVPMGY